MKKDFHLNLIIFDVKYKDLSMINLEVKSVRFNEPFRKSRSGFSIILSFFNTFSQYLDKLMY